MAVAILNDRQSMNNPPSKAMKRPSLLPLNTLILQLLLRRLVVPALFLLLISLVLTSYVGILNARYRQIDQVRVVSSRVDEYLEHAAQVLKMTGEMASRPIGTYRQDNLQVIWKAYGYFDTIYILDGQGRIASIAPLDFRYLGIDMTSQPYYSEVKEKGEMWISQPFSSIRTGKPAVNIAWPLPDDGIIVGELSLGVLQETIQSYYGKKMDSEILVASKPGTLLASPSPNPVDQQETIHNLSIFRKGQAGDYSRVYWWDDNLVLGSATQMDQTSWIVISQTSLVKILFPTIFFLLVAILAGSGLTAYFFWNIREYLSVKIAKPLESLARVVEMIRFGKRVDQTTPLIDTGGIAEVEHLAESFRKMQKAIQTRQTALVISENRFRELTELLPDIIYEMDLNGFITYSNRAGFESLGYTLEDLAAGTLGTSLLVDDDITRAEQSWKTIAAGQSPKLGNYCLKRKDGSVFSVEIATSVIRDFAGQAVGFRGVVRDITDRLKAEAALYESEERFCNLFEQSYDAIILIDRQGKIAAWNTSARDIIGLDPGQAIGRFAWELQTLNDLGIFKSEENPEKIKEIILETLKTGRSDWLNTLVETKYRRLDGQIRYLQQVASPIRANDGYMLGLIARDVTEQRNIREQLERVYRLFIRGPVVVFRCPAQAGLPLEYVSPNVEQFGFSPDLVTIEKKPFTEMIHPEDRDFVLQEIQRHVESSEPYFEMEYRIIQADGEVRRVLGVTAISRDEASVPVFFDWYLLDITERWKVESRLEKQLERLAALRKIDISITTAFDLENILSVIIDQLIIHLKVDAVALVLVDDELQFTGNIYSKGFHSGNPDDLSFLTGEWSAGQVLQNQGLVILPEIHSDAKQELAGEGIIGFAGVPVIAKGVIRGVLEVFQCSKITPDDDWRNFLVTIAGQAAIAIDNTALFASLNESNQALVQAYDQTIEGWARALEMRDVEMAGHSRRVTQVTLMLSQAMNIAGEQLDSIRRGALLHDIGKMGIPDSILLKAGRLGEQEWEIMKKHPQYAVNYLSGIDFLKPALDIPYCHHERWDGCGYPQGLKGEEIPLAARIFAVVDVWDSLRSSRPYKESWSSEQVYEYLQQQAGKQFDPLVVQTFFNMMPPETWPDETQET